MVEGNPEGSGNQREEVREEVTLRDIRDEIRNQGRASRNHQWLPVGVTASIAFVIGGAGVIATSQLKWLTLGLIMVLGGASLFLLIVWLSRQIKD